ncbi:MAG: hypothetical protein JST42_10290 [Bacteroidetes bacterium]|nr:hypothetical protein [Bacteroidota bacterium]
MTDTIRTLDAATQQTIHERTYRTVTRITQIAGATARLYIDDKTLITLHHTQYFYIGGPVFQLL